MTTTSNRSLFWWRFNELKDLPSTYPHFVKGNVVVIADSDEAARAAAADHFFIGKYKAHVGPWVDKGLLSCTNVGPAGDRDEAGAVYLNGIRMPAKTVD
jgi:hypothetical protein